MNQMCSGKITPQKPEVKEFNLEDKNVHQIVMEAVRELKNWGVLLPEEIGVVFCDDVNCHMCQEEKIAE